MPRKYHRPPAVKRRKERKTNVPYAMPEEPLAANGGRVAVEHDDADAVEAADAPALGPVSAEGRPTRLSTPSHIGRDYSYVRTEMLRIAGVAAFLTVALILTAIVRG